LYNDFYEQGNSDRFDEAVLSKYFTKGAMRKFYVEDSYEEGHYFYCTDFLTHGTISGGPDPDYGDKIVYRLIVTENDGWFKVTNIWDVIKEPVIVHLQVKTIDGALKIVDVKAKYLGEDEVEESDINAAEETKSEDVGYTSVLSDRKLSNDDLEGKTKNELELMRNSIYARHGYIFKREDLQSHFSQFNWYNPTTNDMSKVYSSMSEIEKYNVDFIKKYE